jgi:transcription elongation factor/antiterminator RfaH
MNHWHLIDTKPHQEKIAFDNPTHQNYQYYLPLTNIEKILRGKKILSKEPMFPRYLFVRLNNSSLQNWSPIRSTKGVSHLVNFESHPATLEDEIINNLKHKIYNNLCSIYSKTEAKSHFVGDEPELTCQANDKVEPLKARLNS